MWCGLTGLRAVVEGMRGELRTFRAASVPLFGAIGGLAVPIGIYLLINPSAPDASGWGLPMSTDRIATLKQSGFFAGLSTEDLAALAAKYGRTVKGEPKLLSMMIEDGYKAGEIIEGKRTGHVVNAR